SWHKERSSSQTRTLAILASGSGGLESWFGDPWDALRAFYAEKELGTGGIGTDEDLGVVGLHDLVHDRQTQTRPALESGLEGFKDLFQLGGGDPMPSIAEGDAPLFAFRPYGHRELAMLRHGAHGIVRKVPENLFHAVAIDVSHRRCVSVPAD